MCAAVLVCVGLRGGYQFLSDSAALARRVHAQQAEVGARAAQFHVHDAGQVLGDQEHAGGEVVALCSRSMRSPSTKKLSAGLNAALMTASAAGFRHCRLPYRHCRAIAFPTIFGTLAESANSKPERYASFRIFAIFVKLIFSAVSVTW